MLLCQLQTVLRDGLIYDPPPIRITNNILWSTWLPKFIRISEVKHKKILDILIAKRILNTIVLYKI